MTKGLKKWINRLTSKRVSASVWVLYFSGGQVTGLKTRLNTETGKVHLLSKFTTLCPLSDIIVAKKALSDQGIGKDSQCMILAAKEDCSVALIDSLSVVDDEAPEALRLKMVDKIEFEITDAICEVQKAPGPDDFGLQKPSWWVAVLNPLALKSQLRILDALGASCSVVEALPFAQRNLAQAGAEPNKAKALLCVGENYSSLTFSANGSLLFQKDLDFSETLLGMRDQQLWGRLELDLIRNLDYFERRLAAVITADMCFAGPQADRCTEEMAPKMTMPTTAYDWDILFVDECQALSANSIGTFIWSAGASLRLKDNDLIKES